MAITEWSWQTSNGSASAAQTQAAYNALIGKDYTEKFSRLVWNDLCAKVREVALAVKGDWYSYGGVSYASMLMNSAYGELTSGRFNALRQNTQYPTWRWAYDRLTEGYIGRTDFLGVAGSGEYNSDYVYGVYFIELAQRLNQIIRILNGTEPVYSLAAPARIVLTPSPSSVVLPPAAMRAGGVQALSSTTILSDIPIRSMLNRYTINSPVLRAVMETGQFSDYEARIYMNMSIQRTLRQLPVIPFEVLLQMSDAASGRVVTLEPVVFRIQEQDTLTPYLNMLTLPTASFDAGAVQYTDATVHPGKSRSFPIDDPYWYAVLIGYAELESNNPLHAVAAFQATTAGSSSITQVPPVGIIANASQTGTGTALLEQTDMFKSIRAAESGTIESDAGMEQTDLLTPISATSSFRHTISAVPDIKRYVHPAAAVPSVVSYTAVLEATYEGGWEYPERQEPDTLYIPQVRSTFAVPPRRWLQIDYAYFDDLTAAHAVGTSTSGDASGSLACWTYPVRLNARTLKVFQSLEVTQNDDEIEVK